MVSTISDTLEHILLLARYTKRCDISGATVIMLFELGVSTKYIGFEFLKRAIMKYHKDPTRAFAKDIYQEIADECSQSSEEQVSQAIRDCIKKAWRNGDEAAWTWYFAYNGKRPKRPGNAEFITKLARLLELWNGICEKEVSYESKY